jgi:glutathione S-transferase
MNITLYAAPMSSATPVINAMHELDVPHELVLIDLASGELRKQEFLDKNPNGRVPTLVVDGTPMFEALAIMQWLGDRFGVERGLWPAADAPERLEAMAWTTWLYVTFGAVLQRMIHASSERVDARLHHKPLAEHAQKELQHLLAILDGRLDGRDYLIGDSFTLADLIVGSGITYATFIGVPTKRHDHVEAWFARFHQRPAYKKTWGVE